MKGAPLPRGASSWLFGLRAWCVLLGVGLPTWPLVLACRGRDRRWQWLRASLTLMQRLSGIRVVREGVTPAEGAVLVLNHASFIDGAVLIAASERPLEIAVGAFLEGRRIAGPFLRAIGCVFVGGEDEPARAQLSRLEAVAARGDLAVFPEGHLATRPELERFHLGAFVAACAAGVPVQPAAILGSRAVLAPGSRWPAKATLRVRYGAPIMPSGPRFADARRLGALAEVAVRDLLES